MSPTSERSTVGYPTRPHASICVAVLRAESVQERPRPGDRKRHPRKARSKQPSDDLSVKLCAVQCRRQTALLHTRPETGLPCQVSF